MKARGIEIKNTRSKNIVIASIYRHPHNNFNEFFQYLESCLLQVMKENKELYICGDFNFDLLKIDTDHYILNIFLIYFAAMDFYHIYLNRQE